MTRQNRMVGLAVATVLCLSATAVWAEAPQADAPDAAPAVQTADTAPAPQPDVAPSERRRGADGGRLLTDAVAARACSRTAKTDPD